jgi:hypothetical protein
MKSLSKQKVEILVHPASIQEVANDPVSERKEISTSKVGAYQILDSPPDFSSDTSFLQTVADNRNRTHDHFDNLILYAVFKNAVNFLITEDKEIHKKAQKLRIKNRVLTCIETVEFLKLNMPNERIERPHPLQYKPVNNLNFNDPFFNTLKADYPTFEDWFNKISRAGRYCYVHYSPDGAIQALLILKDEDESILSNPPLPKKRRLKLCTFKGEKQGNRIGELFIKLAVRYCVNNNLDEMYLTLLPKADKAYLVKLLSEYGFLKSSKLNEEDLYLKSLIPNDNTIDLPPLEISNVYYPSFYDGTLVKKFLIPIIPRFHDRLFTDWRKRRQATLDEHLGRFIVAGNTIKKAYLCNSNIGQISKGDLLLFYRSRDLHQLTSIGVVDSAIRMNDADAIEQAVKNRTVYKKEEIQKNVDEHNSTLVILFKWNFYLPTEIDLAKLIELKICKQAPQTLTQISHTQYLTIKKESAIPERYTAH